MVWEGLRGNPDPYPDRSYAVVSRSWIVAHDGTKGRDAYAMECRRCGTIQRFATPIAIEIWCAAARVFARQHKNCKPVSVPCSESVDSPA